MAAATGDRDPRPSQGQFRSIPIKASTLIYLGVLVAWDSTGYGVPAGDTAGHRLSGVSRERGDNSSGANGDVRVDVDEEGEFLFVGSGFTQADEGKPVYVLTDQEVALAADVTNHIYVGQISKVESATQVRVKLQVQPVAAKNSPIADAGDFFVGSDVEAVLQEIAPGAWFKSAEQTGNAAEQGIPHGLARIPKLVLFFVTAGHDNAAGVGNLVPVISEGIHDDTNVNITCTAGAKYIVVAI